MGQQQSQSYRVSDSVLAGNQEAPVGAYLDVSTTAAGDAALKRSLANAQLVHKKILPQCGISNEPCQVAQLSQKTSDTATLPDVM